MKGHLTILAAASLMAMLPGSDSLSMRMFPSSLSIQSKHATPQLLHHRYRKADEEVQLIPEVGLARRNTYTNDDSVSNSILAHKGFHNLMIYFGSYKDSGESNKRSALLLDKLMYALQEAIDRKSGSETSRSLGVQPLGSSSSLTSNAASNSGGALNDAAFSGVSFL